MRPTQKKSLNSVNKAALKSSPFHFIVFQGGHILAKMKFPVFSLSFPCVTEIFPVLFLCKKLTITSMNKGHIATVLLHTEADKLIF